VQALYQQQLAGHSAPELAEQFADAPGFKQADQDYFDQLLAGILRDTDSLDSVISTYASRDLAQLDPVGRAVLWLACYELAECPSVPTRVVIDEAIELAKAYGATDSYRFINAVLDKARKNMPQRTPVEGG
jgi:N utilization substance protein B